MFFLLEDRCPFSHSSCRLFFSSPTSFHFPRDYPVLKKPYLLWEIQHRQESLPLPPPASPASVFNYILPSRSCIPLSLCQKVVGQLFSPPCCQLHLDLPLSPSSSRPSPRAHPPIVNNCVLTKEACPLPLTWTLKENISTPPLPPLCFLRYVVAIDFLVFSTVLFFRFLFLMGLFLVP